VKAEAMAEGTHARLRGNSQKAERHVTREIRIISELFAGVRIRETGS